jgi:hypothetical protein
MLPQQVNCQMLKSHDYSGQERGVANMVTIFTRCYFGFVANVNVFNKYNGFFVARFSFLLGGASRCCVCNNV